MKKAGLLLLTVLAAPALGQSAGSESTTALTCGALKAESSRTASASQWTISGPSGKTAETGVLKSGPRFECPQGAILGGGVTSSAGHAGVAWTLRFRGLFPGRHGHQLWPPADRPPRHALRSSHPGENAHRGAVSRRLRLSLPPGNAGRSHSARRPGGLCLLGHFLVL